MIGIKYYSTNKRAELVSFKEALITGQAPDKGLYMPKEIPKINSELIEEMSNMSYPEIAFIVAKQFLEEDITDDELRKITEESYNFEVPIKKVSERVYMMRLDRGPSASFKDFAARMMSRLMQHYIAKENKKLLILTATSGDTGSAIANAFYDLRDIKVVVLFPKNEVSIVQRKQMTTLNKNITAIGVDGKFDDCQAMVKQAFFDPELKNLKLSSANSINFGRLLPQCIYYFYAYSRAKNEVFSVPSGNFGDLIGGLLAKRMGLPVKKFIVAVNENDEFPRFLETGRYEPIRPSKLCLSNAMNVGHPSNLARLIDLYNGEMDENGKIIKMPDMDAIKKDMFSVSISDDETRKAIKDVYDKYGVILEPHGAVGWAALQRFGGEMVSVVLETAHPAKFPSKLHELDIEVELPDSMKELENKKEVVVEFPADYKAFKKFLVNFS